MKVTIFEKGLAILLVAISILSMLTLIYLGLTN